MSCLTHALPGYGIMRNTGEHQDDYALGLGRNSDVRRDSLQSASWDGTTYEWVGAYESGHGAWSPMADGERRVVLSIDIALDAASRLREHVRQACTS